MSLKPEVGQLWSLRDAEVVVCLTRDASSAQPECFIATIVHSDSDDPTWRQGLELIVHTSGLSCQWQAKPLSGVPR